MSERERQTETDRGREAKVMYLCVYPHTHTYTCTQKDHLLLTHFPNSNIDSYFYYNTHLGIICNKIGKVTYLVRA